MKAVLLTIFLTGCGTIGTISNPEDTDFVVISQSEAGGVYRLISGETVVCKLSKHGVTGLNYNIVFEDGKCKVEVVK